jgi:hypothetical protein
VDPSPLFLVHDSSVVGAVGDERSEPDGTSEPSPQWIYTMALFLQYTLLENRMGSALKVMGPTTPTGVNESDL